MRVNVGGDPGRDDDGLPPVDTEIPDDPRELDHEIRAYQRQLRAERRRSRRRRLYAPLVADGKVLPLVGVCLALTLLAATLLAVLGGRDSLAPEPPVGAGTTGRVGTLLPNPTVQVNGDQVHLRAIAATSALALVPPTCGCQSALRQLRRQAAGAGVGLEVVGVDGAHISPLAVQTGPGAARIVTDPANVLGAVYHPTALTAVLVRANGVVAAVVPATGRGFALQGALRALKAGPSTSPTP